MCGRFVVARVGSELVSELSVDLIGDDLPQPSFNVAPTAQAAIVLDSAKTEPPTRRLESARWGLVPGWAKDISVGARAFNARSETVAEKPTFTAAFARRRTVVPASGYYEWKQADDGKVPLFIHPEGGEPMLFAGLYEWWRDPESAWVLSFTILTRDAVGDLGSIHHRMPVFLDADHADAWLDTDAEAPHDVLRAALDDAPRVAESFAWHEVGRAVGNVRNNSPDLIDPV
ncbi:MAG TPA: SOS response-associated peptidase [Candidatus Microbacterium stercoravium]|uniref:Abasic site processing protein n=1 Tax=Candidatus Microbacterium stercoravium TaxID=2838697 RepID=A0A9D2H5A2_9MICO|nr:SOS response-associated peptidase [Candidatus Microbacterium stercoravium]